MIKNQHRTIKWFLLGMCGAGFFAGVASMRSTAQPIAEPTTTSGSVEVPIPYAAQTKAITQANGKNAWNCGAIKSNSDSLTFNNECAVKAWKQRKPFHLQLETYDARWGGYNGTLFGDNSRRLFLNLHYSSVQGTWRIEKEIKNAFIAKRRGKDTLFWKEQKQDLGVTYPKNISAVR